MQVYGKQEYIASTNTLAIDLPFAFNTNQEFILGRRRKRHPPCDLHRLGNEMGTDHICCTTRSMGA